MSQPGSSDTSRLRHLYGPVPSRRLGHSLGIDLIPYKTCSYDCLYCQLGRTTERTCARRETVPPAELLAELRQKLAQGPPPDYLGLAGAGEPTLYSRLGELIVGIKRLTDIPVAVLTNGSLLWQPAVRQSLQEADLVLPSLDAGDEETFQRVNRPDAEVTFSRLIDGLVTFRQEFRGPVWLEVFLLPGINDSPASLDRIAAHARRIAPTRVQLNTVARPPAEPEAHAATADALAAACQHFDGLAEVIAETSLAGPELALDSPELEARIVALLARRPCTVQGIAAGLGLAPNEVLKALERLDSRGLTDRRLLPGGVFHGLVRPR
ncbi:MAG: radical SAM protein [Myxococcota bacterium]|jgi:wyosine [tRNA(Phe)-imidazoG37] synthetase (radical SAM superfamily)|nr:radical SAM protein [Myxococcota bacterium]